jgi:hypothetical protein
MERAIESARSENPLEAWTKFIDTLDLSGRKLIGEQLRKSERNQYTGEERITENCELTI